MLTTPGSQTALVSPSARGAFPISLIWNSLDFLDRLTLAYLALVNLLIFSFPSNLRHPALFFSLHLLVACGVVSLAWVSSRSPSPLLRFVRHASPLLLFLIFFEELGALVHLLHAGWFDSVLIAFDYTLFGVHPTVWLQRFSSPMLNDFLQFAYFTYYLYPLLLGTVLFTRQRFSELRFLMTASALAYYPGYLISILFPIEGPFHALASLHTVPLHGGPITSLIDFIEHFGRVHGAAFPSAHVSGATVSLLCAWYFFSAPSAPKTEAAGSLHPAARFSGATSSPSAPVVSAAPDANPSPFALPWFQISNLKFQISCSLQHMRATRILFWLLLPFYLAMLLATVFGRYHYFADVLAGLFIGLLGFLLARRFSLPPPQKCAGS